MLGLFKKANCSRTAKHLDKVFGSHCSREAGSESCQAIVSQRRGIASTSPSGPDDIVLKACAGSLFAIPSIIGRELLVPTCAKAVLENETKHGHQLMSSLWNPQFLEEAQRPSIDRIPEIKFPDEIIIEIDGRQLREEIAEPPVSIQHDSLPQTEEQPKEGLLMSTKRTYQPGVLVRKRRHGFLSRLRSVGGRRVINRRRVKGRRKLTA